MNTIIRADLSTAEHATALVRLMNEYASGATGGNAPLSAETQRNLAAALHARPGAHTLLATEDGHYVGLLNAFEGFSTFACQPLLNIHDVIVTTSHRGKGLGRLLMEHAELLARELGCCKLTLEVLEGNLKAQAAYQALGYAAYELDPSMGKAWFWEKKL
jgi:GNAT superfamily N-acetyltransferase